MIFDNEPKFQVWANGVLDKLGVHYIHISSKNRAVRKGILDLICFYKGKSFCIELKQKYQKLRPEQKIEMDKLKEHDINCYLCYTDTEFLNVLKKEMIISGLKSKGYAT